jgi:hypothetical protein
MALPFPEIWRTTLPGFIRLPAQRIGDELVTSADDGLHGIAVADGRDRWRVTLDAEGGLPTFLYAHGQSAIADRRVGPKRLVEIVAVRDQKLAWAAPLDGKVPGPGTVVVGNVLYAIVDDDAADLLRLRAVELERGARVLDAPLPRGGGRLQRAGDTIIVGGRARAGIYRIDLEGHELASIETRDAYVHAVDGGRVLATIDLGRGLDHTLVEARALDDARLLWEAPARGSNCALDGDIAVHTEGEDKAWIPVVRDAASGDVRWRGDAMKEMPGTIQFAGDYLFFTYMRGMIAYRRDDGRCLGELAHGRSVRGDDGRLYIGAEQSLTCTRDA